jgi:hypothetical protein
MAIRGVPATCTRSHEHSPDEPHNGGGARSSDEGGDSHSGDGDDVYTVYDKRRG